MLVAVTVYEVFTEGAASVGSSTDELYPAGLDVQLKAAAVEVDATDIELIAQYHPQFAV